MQRASLASRLAPFALAAMLAWLSVLVGSSIDWTMYEIATALLLLAGALRMSKLRSRFGGTLSSLIFLASVGVLRDATGGISSGVGVLSLIPIFYTALYQESRRWLYVVLAGVASFYLVPILVVGPPDYPHSQYRAALLTIIVGAIIGLATRSLVSDVRHQAGEALDRERMLARVGEVMRGLLSSPNARFDVCDAARTIGEASVAMLYEPVRGTRMMRSTATAGINDIGPIEVPLGKPSAVSEAFLTGQARMITEDVEAYVGSRTLWEAGGSPTSVLYEPLTRGGDTVGVLVVGWPTGIRAEGARAAVVSLLAHEAAAVIERADTLTELAGMASTDPLTGLPNRRTWDENVAEVLAAGKPFTVAMLDLDHFKEFNDTYGHPAGDRLLKETAAAWRDQLRSGDLLARLGGEEFGLLLLACDADRATEVIERLRGLIGHGRTCSAGFSAWRPGEAIDAVMARADAALYEAKESGRDRVCMSA